ncbi:hypothetical protein [uncultured Mobiluncus sp.]|mgnify:FL=1|uniref:hypothetical protein n=1 Tax=uncultured Mobiluncus sp. TaxID=293425 RepID=UPI00263574A9|nr:hypothetical protein [uncultured Mobiluncus sp.]
MSEPQEPRNPEDRGDKPGDQQAYDAEFADLIAKLGDVDFEPESPVTGPDETLDLPEESEPPLVDRRATACFLTPVASAEALGALCALSGIPAVVVPTDAGALVVQNLELTEEQWGMALLVESLNELDSDLDTVASTLTEIIRMPVVVFSALLAPGTEQEPGVTGQVLAGRWANQAFEADLPAGLVIAQMPIVIEDLVLGRVNPADVDGAVDTVDMPRWKALRMLGKGIKESREERRRQRGQADSSDDAAWGADSEGRGDAS